jgi:hypothetical protein
VEEQHFSKTKKEVKLILQQAVEAHEVLRHQGSHIFKTIGLEMVVRLPPLSTGCPAPSGSFLVLIC